MLIQEENIDRTIINRIDLLVILNKGWNAQKKCQRSSPFEEALIDHQDHRQQIRGQEHLPWLRLFW